MSEILFEEDAQCCAAQIDILKDLVERMSCQADRDTVLEVLRPLEKEFAEWERKRQECREKDPKIKAFLALPKGGVVTMRRPTPFEAMPFVGFPE